MATFAPVFEGVLGAQLGKLDASDAVLTGADDRVVLPGEFLYDVDPDLLFKTFSAVDVPGATRAEISQQQDYANVSLSLATSLDPESLALTGAANAWGTATETFGMQTLSGQLSAFCDAAGGSSIYALIWACAKGPTGKNLVNAASDRLYGLYAFPKLTNVRISDFPGINRAGEAPDPWTLSAVAYPNTNFGSGPGGVLPITGAPTGAVLRGLTNIAPPALGVDLETFTFGYGSHAAHGGL